MVYDGNRMSKYLTAGAIAGATAALLGCSDVQRDSNTHNLYRSGHMPAAEVADTSRIQDSLIVRWVSTNGIMGEIQPGILRSFSNLR